MKRLPKGLAWSVPVQVLLALPEAHQRVYKMGMEHFGVVVGEGVHAFSRRHREALTGLSSSRTSGTSRITSCSRTSLT